MDWLDIYKSVKHFTLSMESPNDMPLLDGSQFRIPWFTIQSNKMESMSSMSLSKRLNQVICGGLFCFVLVCFVLSTSCCKRTDKVLQENAGKTENNERTIGAFKWIFNVSPIEFRVSPWCFGQRKGYFINDKIIDWNMLFVGWSSIMEIDNCNTVYMDTMKV